MAEMFQDIAFSLLKRDASEADSDESEVTQHEIYSSMSLFILLSLLIVAFFMSYILQTRRIQAVHETVISIFAGMFVGLILRLTTVQSVLSQIKFQPGYFFNLLLPPIILASGYELHQGNFFRHIGTILTFAFAGTFISALVLGVILYLWSLLGLDSLDLSFVDAMSVGATLSATDPVTILAIFNTYKVDPNLYTVIFGESILNDAVAIVLFQTAQRYAVHSSAGERRDENVTQGSLTLFQLVESFGVFTAVFFGSLVIGLAVGIGTSLLLKYTHVRRFPKIESCLVLLIAYVSYFFANAISMSGIVSLLFCGICLKHYAYYNMSRRTQLTTKFMFQVLAQLSENFIFVYLGLSLFTEQPDFRPLFILVTVVGICIGRGLAVFPLSQAVNWIIRYRAKKRGDAEAEEVPLSHQIMLFWAGLRGAVGVALAMGLSTPLQTTVLVVVVLTVIIFGGTTSRMLEILGIRTGVNDEPDSDDEFDIEFSHKRFSDGYGPHAGNPRTAGIALSSNVALDRAKNGKLVTGSRHGSPGELYNGGIVGRKNSLRNLRDMDATIAAQGLLASPVDTDDDATDLDLPPAARRTMPTSGARGEPTRTTSAPPATNPPEQSTNEGEHQSSSSVSGFRQLLTRTADDPAQWFRQLDEGFIKPTLLLDPGDGNGHQHGPGNV